MLSDQRSMSPWSTAASLTTHSLHVPFAQSPSKTDRSTLPEGTGAGAGKTSVVGS
jgi:hypothetical protein